LSYLSDNPLEPSLEVEYSRCVVAEPFCGEAEILIYRDGCTTV